MTEAIYAVADVRDALDAMPDDCIDLVLTSPPFLALRSYLPDGHEHKAHEIGSEATPAAYLDTLLEVTARLGRVLAPHGSIVIELGDTYSESGGAGGDYRDGGLHDGQNRFRQTRGRGWPLGKSLCAIPQLYEASLIYGRNLLSGEPSPAGRWRVRNLCPWIRPTTPPGALGDKFRPATTYLTVATRSRDRFFDLDAVRTVYAPQTLVNAQTIDGASQGTRESAHVAQWHLTHDGAPPTDWINVPLDDDLGDPSAMRRPPRPAEHPHTARGVTARANTGKAADDARRGDGHRSTLDARYSSGGAPPTDWIKLATQPYKGAHYATFPAALCERPIKAMCPLRVCRVCGEPQRRITSADYEAHGDPERQHAEARVLAAPDSGHNPAAQAFEHGRATKVSQTLGWTDCGHGRWRAGRVLDPFAGTGTTLAVATGHGRDAIGIDIDGTNIDLAIARVGGLFIREVTLDGLERWLSPDGEAVA